jgi:putative CocE/NonD family hydrolase
MPGSFTVVVEKDVPLTTRDGTILRSDVYRPQAEGTYPVLLGRTQYNKETWGAWMQPERTAGEGYVVVLNDMRGQYTSEGEFDPHVYEVDDSYDVIEWCAAQPWSTGKVGMFGSSACGFVQLLAAVGQPPHLTAIAPKETWSNYGRGCVYDQGGGFSLYHLQWCMRATFGDPSKRIGRDRPDFAAQYQAVSDAIWDMGRWYQHLPLLEDMPVYPRELAPFYYRSLEHPDNGEYWDNRNVADKYARMQTPALHLVGWFDRFCISTVQNYLGIRDQSTSEVARRGQKLIIGPWPHSVPVATASGEHSWGPNGYVDVRGLMLRWYDYWLKGIDNGYLDEPPVRLFILGENAWRDEQEWPLARTQYVEYYLHSGGSANTLDGDGTLSTRPPSDEPIDVYLYDPSDPTPSVPGVMERPTGPVDQRPIEQRQDVLVYTSPPLERDTEITGPVVAHLWAATSAVDTDWVVKLVDVHPDGYAFPLSPGMIRARYRESQSRQKLLEPDRVYEYTIEMRPVGNLFKAGHRIRVEIASAIFPEFDANFNTGGVFGTESKGIVATQRVFHDAERPSHVVLPIVPR